MNIIRNYTNQLSQQLQELGMWSIREEDNESNTEQSFPEEMRESTKSKLRLVKLGGEEDVESEQSEIDLDGYLGSQRATTNAFQKKEKPKTYEQKEAEKQFVEGYGIGYKLLKNMGFKNVTKGLGKNEQGRTNIVEAEFKTALTAKDEDEAENEATAKLDEEEEKQKKKEEILNRYGEFKFEQIFTYRSKVPHVNNLLLKLKSKYQTLQAKQSLLSKETESFSRDMQIAESSKLQKMHEIEQIQEQINGLQHIQQSTSNVNSFPHLGMAYSCDLLMLKESIERLVDLPLTTIGPSLVTQVKNLKRVLSNLYLAKQKQSLRGYSESTGFHLKVQEYYEQTGVKANVNFFSTPKMEDAVTTMSPQDEQKIRRYVSTLIEETVMKNKLQRYFKQLRDISECQQFVIDLVEIIRIQSATQLQGIIKYLIPLANKYLRGYQPSSSGRRLPHHVIFPWLLVIKIEQLDIQRFLHQITSHLWKIESNELFDTMGPWLKHMPPKSCKFFINFYLAPRLLHELEQFQLEDGNKQILKGLKKYCDLIPNMQTKKQILNNSLFLKLLQAYQRESKISPVQQMRGWAQRWEKMMDKICLGAMRSYMGQHGIVYA